MDETARIPLTALDRIADGNGLQVMKAAIPYLPSSIQRSLSLYVKFLEIQNLLSYYNNQVSVCSSSSQSNSPDEFLSELCNYATEEQRQTLEQTLNVLNTLKMYQECKDIF